MKRLLAMAAGLLLAFSAISYAGPRQGTATYDSVGPNYIQPGDTYPNLTITGTLTAPVLVVTVSTNVSINGYAAVGTTMTVGSTLGVGDTITAAKGVYSSTMVLTGAATVGSTLGVTGATTLSSTLSAADTITASKGIAGSTVALTGNASVGGTLGVTGAVTLSSTLGVTGMATFAGLTNTGATYGSYVLASDSATLTVSSATFVECSKASPQSITLPTAVSNTGLKYTIKKTGSGVYIVKLITNSTETIDGTDDNILIKTQYDYLTIVSNGTNWLITERYIQ